MFSGENLFNRAIWILERSSNFSPIVLPEWVTIFIIFHVYLRCKYIFCFANLYLCWKYGATQPFYQNEILTNWFSWNLLQKDTRQWKIEQMRVGTNTFSFPENWNSLDIKCCKKGISLFSSLIEIIMKRRGLKWSIFNFRESSKILNIGQI